jgi:putative membrane protein
MRTMAKVGVAVLVAGLMGGTAMMAQTASSADKAFVGKVSQGGLYEVEAGRVAAMRGMSPVVKDFGLLESQDHEGVNSRLKAIAGKTGVSIKPGLNAEFRRGWRS